MTANNTTAVLRRIRFARGLSQLELARRAGIAPMTLWSIEMCRHKRGAHAHVRAALERELGVSYDVLAAPDTEEQNDPARLSEAASPEVPYLPHNSGGS